jgi:hypothetical protein
LAAYDHESRPLLEHYGEALIEHIDATKSPVEVLAHIVNLLVKDRLDGGNDEGFVAVG